MKTLGKKLSESTVLSSDLLNSRGGRVMNDKGEISASSKHDMMQQMSEIMAALARGEKVMTVEEASAEEQKRKKRREVLSAVIADRDGPTAKKVGQEMAGVINQNLSRMGFARNIMRYETLEAGQRPEVYVQTKNVTAAVMTGPTQAQLQVVRDNTIFPPEVDITARLIVEGRVMNVSREDILQRKFDEGLEQVLVQEDKMFKVGVDTLTSAMNQVSTHVGLTVSPAVFEAGMSMILDWNMPMGSILFASNLWSNFITNRDFEDLIDPVTRLEILRTGRIGTWYGFAVMTDGVREPTQKVLDNGDIYFFSTPEYVGEYTDRGGVMSTPLGVAETGVNGAGWHLAEYWSQALPNHRAVARTRLA